MIIDVNGKKVAFGLAWKRLVGGGTPESMAISRAREHKSVLIWTDGEALQVGLLPAADLTEKDVGAVKVPVFAAAKIVSRIPGLKKNVLLALNNPNKTGTFILVGIYKGKPRDKFDLADISGEILEQKVAEYRDLLKNEPFDLIGDVRGIEGIYSTPIGVLAEHADEGSAMHRPKAQLPVRKVGIAVGIVLACFLIAKVASPVIMKKWRDYHDPKQPNPQKLYDDVIAQARLTPSLKATDLGPWYQWFRELPWDVGGWRLAGTSCSFTPSALMVCAVDYKRALTQGTYKTFVAALPEQWKHAYKFDQDVAHVQVTSPIGLVGKVGQFLDQAPTENAVTMDFGSQLQGYQVAGKFTITPFGLFGADGIDASSLQNTYKVATWTMDGPVRDFELLGQFPPYALVSSISVVVQSDPQSTIDNSMFKATVKGQVLIRG